MKGLYHAIKIDKSKCTGCIHCMRSCPTEAIRINKGKANIIHERCIDCGQCYRACKQRAIRIEEDDLDKIFSFKHRVALFPSVLVGQFPPNISGTSIYALLTDIGFTDLYEVEQSIGPIHKAMEKHFETSNQKQFLTSFCPSVLRLIQMRYSDLLENLIPIKAPHDVAAHQIRKRLESQGIPPEDIGVFYITPCSAKMAAVQNPVGEEMSLVDGTINMKEVYNRVMAGEAEGKEITAPAFGDELTSEGIVWSLPNGEASNFDMPSIAVDGIHNVINFLERLENEDIENVELCELRGCHQGCAGGICMSGNRFLTANRLRERSKKYQSFREQDLTKFKKPDLALGKIEARPLVHLDSDFSKALEKMERARRIMCHLPGIDCGSCGAPTCSALADDMVTGKAKMSDCIYIQQKWQAENRMSSQKAFKQLEEKWGDDRFNFDCTKRGAKFESIK